VGTGVELEEELEDELDAELEELEDEPP